MLYIGEGAGLHDTGEYRIGCLEGGLTLAWRYRVIRLWQMPAAELLALGRPALLTLLGQTHIEPPGAAGADLPPAGTQVAGLTDPARLRELLGVALRATDITEFEVALAG